MQYIVGITEPIEADSVTRAVELFLANFRGRDLVHVEVLNTETEEVVVVDAKFVAGATNG